LEAECEEENLQQFVLNGVNQGPKFAHVDRCELEEADSCILESLHLKRVNI
jgi:hypothetical protein